MKYAVVTHPSSPEFIQGAPRIRDTVLAQHYPAVNQRLVGKCKGSGEKEAVVRDMCVVCV
jgi:hypothetical protein